MENLFEAIKAKDLNEIKELINENNINSQDDKGRTPLIYSITQNSPIEIFDLLLESGADPNILDKLKHNALTKAIKFKKVDFVKRLLDKNIKLDHPKGIAYTPWFQARNTPLIADLLLDTNGAIRLTLTTNEKNIVNKLLYKEKITFRDLDKLNSPELMHHYILNFNYDDDISLLNHLVKSNHFKEVTAIELLEAIDVTHWLDYEDEITNIEQSYLDLIQNIFNKFPQLGELDQF